MGRDETGTLAAIKADRRQLFEPKAAQYHGRTVKLMGDGALMEFASVVDAVRFAVEVQCALQQRNAGIAEDRRVQYRIGINIGDIVADGEDIYGDGVNIAARLQAIADPGGICLAHNAYNQIKGKLDLEVESLGEKEVKNIADPVGVYRVLLDGKAAAIVTPLAAAPARASRIRPWHAAAALVALLLLGTGAWWTLWRAPTPGDPVAPPLPDKPSIAVLPFTNMSADPEQEYFASGMTESLITDLSQVSALFVISRNSTFAYKDKPADVRQIAQELGVRYVLEGSVQRAGDRVRINAQLIDGLNGGHLWADRYDGPIADVFQLQDKVTRSITDALALRLTAQEQLSIGSAETKSPPAYDAFLQGRQLFRQGTPADLAAAIPFFEKATRLDPEYWRAYAALALVYWRLENADWYRRAGVDRSPYLADIEKNLAKAAEHPTSTLYQVIGNRATISGETGKAGAAFKEAIALDPSDSWSYAYMSRALTLAGQPAEAMQYIRTAMRIDPHYPTVFDFYLGFAQFNLEQFDDAAAFLERGAQANPDDDVALLFLAATYGYLGRKEDAAAAIAAYNAIYAARGRPPITARFAWYLVGYTQRTDRDRLFKGLILAGVPDLQPGSQ
jgi:TolB-like protein/Tfp pilus assembly protein PilF